MPSTAMDVDSDPSTSLITPQSERTTRARKRRRSPSPSKSSTEALARLQPAELLLELPNVLAHPPDHKLFVASYVASLAALRACAMVEGVAADVECRAWTGFAELGLKVVGAGWSQDEHFPWARNFEDEIEAAIGRALVLVQQCPSLSVYKLNLTILHARLAHFQQNTKFSRNLLKRVTSTFTPPPPQSASSQLGFSQAVAASQPPTWVFYAAHLAGIAHSLALPPPDVANALLGVQELQKTAEACNDPGVVLLSRVLRLRTLVDAGMWNIVSEALSSSETALGLSYDDADSLVNSPSKSPSKGKEKEQTFVSFDDPFEAAMAIHVLVMAVVYFTHVGAARSASARLAHLHALLDSDVLLLFPEGILEIKLNHGPPLLIKGTHPRVLYHLAYLVSSVSKRDAVGRKPRRKVFAIEGLAVWDKEMRKDIKLPIWADPRDAEEIDERMVKIKADLLSELAAACIMRSEFDEAEDTLNQLIAHTRTYGIFPSYAARITLHHAHLAHAMGNTSRARTCYECVTRLAEEGTAVNVAARAGLKGLGVGKARPRAVVAMVGRGVKGKGKGKGKEREAGGMGLGLGLSVEDGETMGVVESCRGMGGTLEAVGHVLHACVSSEILSAKHHLKSALDLASRAQDNHLRALVLALVSALYFRTAPDHARAMLETCGTLAAGMGAVPKDKEKDGDKGKGKTPRGKGRGKGKEREGESGGASDAPVGNAPLGLWVGQRFLELYKREENEHKVRKQELANARLAAAVVAMETRWKSSGIVDADALEDDDEDDDLERTPTKTRP